MEEFPAMLNRRSIDSLGWLGDHGLMVRPVTHLGAQLLAGLAVVALTLTACGQDDDAGAPIEENANEAPTQENEPSTASLSGALAEKGFDVESVTGLTPLPISEVHLSPGQKKAQDLPDETQAVGALSTPLPGGTGYVYEFENGDLAQAAMYNFLADSNYNEVAGCGSHVFYSSGKSDAADRWTQEVARTLKELDPGCRDGSTFGVIV